MTDLMPAKGKIVLLHTMDPRGEKLGGIETHVRQVLACHPDNLSVLMIGVDEIGDLTLGYPVDLAYGTRRITFLPVSHVPAGTINKAATRVWQSTTLHFALGLVRYLAAIHRATGDSLVSCEIERFEFAFLPKLLGQPLVLIVHNEGTRKDAMDSLLKRYWFLHRFNERLALMLATRIFAVNSSIAARVTQLSRRLGAKTEVMSVSVDTRIFVPTPFRTEDDAFRICFAGRLDAFKDPPLMFATIARLADKLAASPSGRFRRVAFDYVGASDPSIVPEFAAIEGLTVRHGIRRPAEVAAIMQATHAGIITSFFEGMPCYLLEMLACGRPVAAITLPQFASVIVPGASGCLFDRLATTEVTADGLADCLKSLASAIDAGDLDPHAIATRVEPYSVDAQLVRLFACHERLAAGTTSASSASQPIRST